MLLIDHSTFSFRNFFSSSNTAVLKSGKHAIFILSASFSVTVVIIFSIIVSVRASVLTLYETSPFTPTY